MHCHCVIKEATYTNPLSYTFYEFSIQKHAKLKPQKIKTTEEIGNFHEVLIFTVFKGLIFTIFESLIYTIFACSTKSQKLSSQLKYIT